MKKEQFLEIASQMFDLAHPNQVSNSTVEVSQSFFTELADQIASEVHDLGMDIVSDYELELHCNEVTLEGVDLYHSNIEDAVKNVLRRYLEVKD